MPNPSQLLTTNLPWLGLCAAAAPPKLSKVHALSAREQIERKLTSGYGDDVKVGSARAF